MQLTQQLQHVSTQEDLIRFITMLAEDIETNQADWENRDLLSYLKAMAAWLADSDGYYLQQGQHLPVQPSWKVLAEILLAAKFYE